MLFHESSHGLIQKVSSRGERRGCRIKQTRERPAGTSCFSTPRARSRDRSSRTTASEYKPYLYATGLFDRAWPRFRAPVEQHVQGYIDGKTTLDQMAVGLAAAIP